MYVLNKRGNWLNAPDEVQIKIKKENEEEIKTLKVSKEDKHLQAS